MAVHLNHGTVDIVADDRDIRFVLEQLFLDTGMRFDLPPEVTGNISVSIHNATYEQALKLILGHDFTYHIGPHDTIMVHRQGTTWRPGGETSY